ncbi:hypothetical protein Tco_1265157, partial [Tanacetum coccineum]
GSSVDMQLGSSWLQIMFSFLLTEIESADYVSAGHVLVPADRDRIC